jgi:hypothetical protein
VSGEKPVTLCHDKGRIWGKLLKRDDIERINLGYVTKKLMSRDMEVVTERSNTMLGSKPHSSHYSAGKVIFLHELDIYPQGNIYLTTKF